MRIRKNRNGAFKDIGIWFLTIIVFGAVMGIIFMVLNAFVEAQVDTGNFRLYLIEKRIILSPDCLAYQEIGENLKTGKTVYGAVDLSKFIKDGFLKNCINDDNIGIRITLVDMNNQEYYYNKDKYDELYPLSRFEDYLGYDSTRLVNLVDGDKRSSVIMKISIATYKDPKKEEENDELIKK